jgi:hypothetical protein
MRRLALLLALALIVAACSSDTSAVAASDASDRIAEELRLPDDVKPCLTTEFDQNAAARRALDPESAPSEGELDALSDVVATCVPAETFAASVSAQMATGYRPVADIPPEKEQCLRQEMAQLPDDDRGLFVTGPVSRLRDPGSERSLAVSDLLKRLLDACGIVVGGTPTSAGTLP